jgi:hypothetical protein
MAQRSVNNGHLERRFSDVARFYAGNGVIHNISIANRNLKSDRCVPGGRPIAMPRLTFALARRGHHVLDGLSANDPKADIDRGFHMRTIMLSDELRDQFRHNSSAYGKRIAT